MREDSRPRATHWLTPDGTVACNPRDREATHRAAQGKLAAAPAGALDAASISCPKCRAAWRRHVKARREG